MAKTNPELLPRTGGGELARGSLRLPDAIAISVSVLAPGRAMLLNVPGVAAVSGGSTPLAFLLGGIGCLALAFVVIGFTRRMASAGYAYAYAYTCAGYLAADLLGLSPGLWIVFFFIGMILFMFLSIIRIRVTTRVQLVIGVATVAITLIVVGFETAADFGEETSNPRRYIPIAVITATVMALLIGYPLSDHAFGHPFSNYYFWATTGTLVIIVVYIMLCLGSIVFFYRTRTTRNWKPLIHVAIPLGEEGGTDAAMLDG
jgi:amino acid transporter